LRTSRGDLRALTLVARPVADFYRDFMATLAALGVHLEISDRPCEIAVDAIPFHEDRKHADYDPDPVERWWQIVSQSARVLEAFRAEFLGKSSPVHFFWGSFDLAVSRFSGRRVPGPELADPIQRESYSHEVSSAGFWPGDERYPAPAYYAYTVPAPPGLADARVLPRQAVWHPQLSEFLLPYEAVRRAESPWTMLWEFVESTYGAGADLAGWDRASLERPRAEPPRPHGRDDAELRPEPA
jgi:hypothetical protein